MIVCCAVALLPQHFCHFFGLLPAGAVYHSGFVWVGPKDKVGNVFYNLFWARFGKNSIAEVSSVEGLGKASTVSKTELSLNVENGSLVSSGSESHDGNFGIFIA
jgi:hypothetical protein